MEQQQQDYNEIDLLDFLRIVLGYKRFIIWFTMITVFATAGLSLLMPNIYEAKAILVPVEQQKDSNALAGIASQFGLSVGSPAKGSEIVSQFKSNVVREAVIRNHKLLSLFFEPDDLKGKTENEQIWEGLRFLDRTLNANYREKDGLIEATMDHRDPKTAVNVLNWTLLEVTNRMSGEAKRVAEINRKYLESIVDKTADPFIKVNIYNLIAQQTQTEMAAEAKENFAFKVIDPPKEPDKKAKPKRAFIVVISFVTSVLLSVFLAFLKEFIGRNEQARVMLEAEKQNLRQIIQFWKRKPKSENEPNNPTKRQEEH